MDADELVAESLLRDGCPRCGSLTRLVGDICATCFDELVGEDDANLRNTVVAKEREE